MHESWRQQAWAEKTSTLLHKELADNVDKHQIKTIWVCALFSLLGGLFMVCVGFAITRPLKRISTDMLSMAKLEFLSAQAEIIIDRDGVDERSAHRTRFLSEHLKKLFSDLAQRTRTRRFSKNSDDSAGFTDGEQCSSHSGSEETVRSRHGHSRRGVGSGQSTETNRTNRGYDRDGRDGHDCEDLEAPSRSCFRFSTPKEVLDMRESYVYMVTGLKSFARYLDPEIMRILVKSKRQAQLGMGRADVTIFFSDIANFTTMAEQLEPETFMSLLTEYLDEMSKIIMAKRGVVGEFIGDAIMAWWNVPIDLGQEHTAMALDAALCQQLRLQELRDVWEAKSLPEVRVRMGLVRGTVLAGNIGSSQRMKYGLVGDSVNLASRLEGLCKYYGVSVIIEQEAAFAPAVQNRFHLRLLDLVTVKGRTQATELYQLLAEKGDLPDEFDAEEDLQYFIGGFAEIHRLYRSKNFGACAEALKQYRRQFPQDTPSKMLLRRVETLLNEGLPADWDAVHRLVEK